MDETIFNHTQAGDGEILFSTSECPELMRFAKNGDIYIKGIFVENDPKLIIDTYRYFLQASRVSVP